MIAVKKNLSLDQGATFKQTFRYKDAQGNPIDLDGWSGTFRIVNRFSGENIKVVECDLSPIGTAVGYIVAYIPDEETAVLERATEVYALELEDPSGDIIRLLYGQIVIRGVMDV